MNYKSGLFFIFLIFGFPGQGLADEYDTSIRPGAGGPPTEIKVGIFVVDVVKIDELSETFLLDFSLIMRWKDERLADPEQSKSRSMRLNEIWRPRITYVNLRQINKLNDPHVIVSPDGTVQYSQRSLGELTSNFNLRDFPFDSQDLPIHLTSRDFIDQVVLVHENERTGQLMDAGLAGWTLQKIDVVKSADSIDFFEYKLSSILFHLKADREPVFHFWKLFFPLFLITVMAATVFWIDPQHFATQISVSTASVFTLTAFLISLSNLTPPVDYMTKADKVVISSMCLVFGALLITVTTSRLGQTGRHELAKNIDRIMRWVYPALTIIFFTANILF